MSRFFRSALFPLVLIVILVFIGAQVFAACGSDNVSGPGCVGEVTKTYTEYEPGMGITSGSVTIPHGRHPLLHRRQTLRRHLLLEASEQERIALRKRRRYL